MPSDLIQTAATAKPGRIRSVVGDIKLAHSVFALPFAVLAVFLVVEADEGALRLAGKLGIVVVCMVAARTWAMLVNRIADREMDGRNPRTRGRAIPAGRLSTRDAVVAVVISGGLFWGAAALFWVFFGNPWPTWLAVPVLGWIALYSYTKRFTVLCHVFLGGALAASPVAAAIAVNPEALGSTPALWFLAGMVLVWVAGFDVIYALQDLAFDREVGLKSIPARLGARGAIWVSRGLHVVALAALVGAWRVDERLGVVFGVGVGLTAGLLLLEHLVLARRGEAGISMAFFTLNGVVSCVLGTLGVIDLLI
jgi:4-hydroxybenzoate polyprenyltransferase